MRIRTANASDRDGIIALWLEAGMGYIRDPGGDIARVLAYDADLLLVAEGEADGEHGRMLGTVTGTWDGRRGWIHSLAVVAPHRRSGVGRELVAEVESRLVERGAHQVNVLVFADNEPALAFWYAHDYGDSSKPVKLLHKPLS